jgi:peptide/nickel transport system substrate-binding protein
VTSGDVIKAEIPHDRPTGISGFVMNTRREQFKDWRVREAMTQMFNFEFLNQTINGGTEPRIKSYFSNSVLGMEQGPATGKVLSLLEPFSEGLIPGVIEGYNLPVSDGSERNRKGVRKALQLMEEAGWIVKDGVMTGANGKPFTFEILERNGSAEIKSILNIYVEALERLGVFATITSIDSAQYKERTTEYDFDMTYYTRGLSLSPGNEQLAYWGAKGVEEPGSRNWMGMNVPAAEAMVETMLTSSSQEDYRAAVKALDRILTAGRYVIPIWYSKYSRLAHDKELHYSDQLPVYGDWIGFLPDVWWYQK